MSGIAKFSLHVVLMFIVIAVLGLGNWRGSVTKDVVEEMLWGVVGGFGLMLVFFAGIAIQIVLKKLFG